MLKRQCYEVPLPAVAAGRMLRHNAPEIYRMPGMMNRRTLLKNGAGSALAFACGPSVFGQPEPQKFKIGMAATLWLGQDHSTANYWRAAAAIAALGIGATEADNSGVRFDAAFGNDPAGFRRLSQKCGVRLMGIYQSLLLHEPRLPEMLAKIRSDGRFLKAVDAKYVALGWDAPPAIGGKAYQRTPQDLRQAITAANEIGRILLDEFGLVTAFHAERDVPAGMAEALLDETDPKYVRFCADVGHLAAMGVDPVAMVKRYSSRLAVSHWKDFAPSLPAPGYLGDGAKGDFIEIGQGVVDFKSLAKLYRQIGFSGWVMLELDRTRKPDVLTGTREMKAYVTDVLKLQFYLPHYAAPARA
jgi:sugar phosphate isomerase/epimerase